MALIIITKKYQLKKMQTNKSLQTIKCNTAYIFYPMLEVRRRKGQYLARIHRKDDLEDYRSKKNGHILMLQKGQFYLDYYCSYTRRRNTGIKELEIPQRRQIKCEIEIKSSKINIIGRGGFIYDSLSRVCKQIS